MTEKERLKAQERLGTCEVIQYNTSEESYKITGDLTSQDFTGAGHSLVDDQVQKSGATIIVAKNARNANSGNLSNTTVEDLKALIVDKASKKPLHLIKDLAKQDGTIALLLYLGLRQTSLLRTDRHIIVRIFEVYLAGNITRNLGKFIKKKIAEYKKHKKQYPIILIADHIPKEQLIELSKKTGRSIICANKTKVRFEKNQYTGDAKLSVAEGENLVNIHPDGSIENLGDTFEISRAPAMNKKNDLINRKIPEVERKDYRVDDHGICEVIIGGTPHEEQHNLGESLCNKEISAQHIGGGHRSVAQSSGAHATILLRRELSQFERELPLDHAEWMEDIIKKITPPNGKTTDKPALIPLSFLTPAQIMYIAKRARRPIVACEHHKVTNLIDDHGDFKSASIKGRFHKYTPIEMPSGAYEYDKEDLGRKVFFPRTEGISKKVQEAIDQGETVPDGLEHYNTIHTDEEQLAAQERFGTCRVFNYGRNSESNNITKLLTSPLNYLGHTLADRIAEKSGVDIIVAKNLRGFNPTRILSTKIAPEDRLLLLSINKGFNTTRILSTRITPERRLFLNMRRRLLFAQKMLLRKIGSDKMTPERRLFLEINKALTFANTENKSPLIVIADHIPEEQLASFEELSKRSGRPIILANNCKMQYAVSSPLNNLRLYVAKGEHLVQLNPNGPRQNLGTVFDIPTERHMSYKNDLLNMHLDEAQRAKCRKQIEIYNDSCEIIQGDVREKDISELINKLRSQKGRNYVAAKKSSEEMTILFMQHGEPKGFEPASVRELRTQNMIKKIRAKNGKPTDKPVIINLCYAATKLEAKRIAIEAKRPIISSSHQAVGGSLNGDGDFIMIAPPRGFYKYSPKQEPSGEYSCDEGEFIGKQLVLPRTEETSRLVENLAKKNKKQIKRVKEPITPNGDVSLPALVHPTANALRRRKPRNSAVDASQEEPAYRERRRLPV